VLCQQSHHPDALNVYLTRNTKWAHAIFPAVPSCTSPSASVTELEEAVGQLPLAIASTLGSAPRVSDAPAARRWRAAAAAAAGAADGGGGALSGTGGGGGGGARRLGAGSSRAASARMRAGRAEAVLRSSRAAEWQVPGGIWAGERLMAGAGEWSYDSIRPPRTLVTLDRRSNIIGPTHQHDVTPGPLSLAFARH
jgi:hypothetical protein